MLISLQDNRVYKVRKMIILDNNSKFILVASNQKQVFLINANHFSIVESKEFPSKTAVEAGSLQHNTGIVALAFDSTVYIYDFLYKKELYVLDTYKKVVNLLIRKNLLIVFSEFRILIHNLEKKQNESYIETINGKLGFFQPNYYSLSLFYPKNSHLLLSKSIWSQKNIEIQGIKYQHGCYHSSAKYIVLSLENVLSFYQGAELAKVYGFEEKIVQIVSNDQFGLIFVLLESGTIHAQNISQQMSFDFEQLRENQLLEIATISEEREKKVQNYLFMFVVGYNIYLWIQKKDVESKRILLKADLRHPQKKSTASETEINNEPQKLFSLTEQIGNEPSDQEE